MQSRELDLANYLIRLRQADPDIAAEVTNVLGSKDRPTWSKDAASALRSLLRVGPKPELESLSTSDDFEPLELESIALRYGRPVIAIKEGVPSIDPKDLDSATWKKRIEDASAHLNRVIPSIGRVNVMNHPSGLDYMGTGWVIDRGVIVTNRHVALEFADRGAQGITFSLGFDRKTPIGVSLDFLEEIGSSLTRTFVVKRVLFIGRDSDADIAFMQIEGDASGMPAPVRLAQEIVPEQTMIAVIGYPAKDSRVPEQALMSRIFGDVYNKKRLSPGFANGVAAGNLRHDCTTLGGNSGSAVIDLRNGDVCGLHFSGVFLKTNYAVPSTVVEQYRSKVAGGEATGPLVDVAPVRLPLTPALEQGLDAMTNELKITIPIEVTVRVGQPVAPSITVTAVPAPSPSIKSYAGPAASTNATVAEAVEAARRDLANRPDVVSVDSGWQFCDGWITDERAVVVSVTQKYGRESLAARGTVPIPKQYLGVPVDVCTAGLTRERLEGVVPEALEATWTSPYKTWDERPLLEENAKMKAIFHASPDAGWANLEPFFQAATKSLTIGMYDFTARHIVGAVRDATKKAGRSLSLVLQRGEDIGKGTKQDDIPDAETVQELQTAVKKRMEFSWASVRSKGALFKTAYHIKVAVRDSSAFWLSSGNWQSSNQPTADPLNGGDTTPPLIRTNNREWHAIIENANLSKLYEDYLKRDREQAADLGNEELPGETLPMVWVPVEYFQPTDAELEAPPKYFKPLVVNKKLRVQPILTPDNYSPLVVELIKSATQTLYFQNQSLSVRESGSNPDHFEALLQALLEKQQEGLDVRIIIRRIGDLRKTVSDIKDYGFDMSNLRLQTNCHTKGIIVDGKSVLLGSQNWTGDGTGYNRDASLIVYDEEVAGYFQDLFLYDFKRVGPPKIDESLPPPVLATGLEGVSQPRMVLMPLERWLGEA